MTRNLRPAALALVALMTAGIAQVVSTAPAHAAATATARTALSGGCWNGARKFIYTEQNGNQHHIVEFDVNISVPNEKWYVAQRPAGFPFSANVWNGYYNSTHKWVGYRWPFDWWDPYAASSWKLCYS